MFECWESVTQTNDHNKMVSFVPQDRYFKHNKAQTLLTYTYIYVQTQPG